MRGRYGLARLAAVLIGATMAAAGLSATGLASARPVAAKTSYLTGVYCTAHSNCWAVGLQENASSATTNQVLHWDGKAWRKVTVPSPGGTGAGDSSEIASVRCAAAKECWAVGFFRHNSGPVLSQMLHWTGTKWSALPVPQPAGTGRTADNQLTDVTCIAARNCWAVGYFGKSGSSQLNLVLHWNGRKWTRLRVPKAGGTRKQSLNQLDSVRCPTPSRCIAVGEYSAGTGSGGPFNQVLTWNGRSWAAQRVPNPGTGTPDHDNTLTGAGCGAKTSCWAVGSFGPTPGKQVLNQVLHWNGRSWSRQLTSQPAGTGPDAQNELASVTCSSGRNCWAVGFDAQSSPSRNQAQHWNGTKWVFAPTPDPALPGAVGRDGLFGVRCTGGSDCWAVGEQASGGIVSDEILHWNGTKWSVWPLA